MGIKVSKNVKSKLLRKHHVTVKEVTECLLNREREALKDMREEHATDPPTLWIIARTNHLRDLKVVFLVKDGSVIIKTAYEPNEVEIQIYNRKARLLD